MFPTAPVVAFSNLLATVFFKKCNRLKKRKCGVTGVFYVIKYNVKVSWACVNQGPYLRDLTKIPFKNPIDSGTMEM